MNETRARVRDLYWETMNTFHAINPDNPLRPFEAYPLAPLLHSGSTGVMLMLRNTRSPYHTAYRTIGGSGVNLLLECLHDDQNCIDLWDGGEYRERIGLDMGPDGCTLHFLGGTSNNTGSIHLDADERNRFTGWLENMQAGRYRDHNGYTPKMPLEATHAR